jgi:hypothetical protein
MYTWIYNLPIRSSAAAPAVARGGAPDLSIVSCAGASGHGGATRRGTRWGSRRRAVLQWACSRGRLGSRARACRSAVLARAPRTRPRALVRRSTGGSVGLQGPHPLGLARACRLQWVCSRGRLGHAPAGVSSYGGRSRGRLGSHGGRSAPGEGERRPERGGRRRARPRPRRRRPPRSRGRLAPPPRQSVPGGVPAQTLVGSGPAPSPRPARRKAASWPREI